MNAKFESSYRSSKTGNIVYRYLVSGTAAEIESYKVTQGSHLVNDEKSGKPFWFTINYSLPQVKLIITRKGSVIADMSALQQANSLIAQFPGPLGDAIAKLTAEQALGRTSAPAAQTAPVAEAAPAPVEEPAEADTDLDEQP